MRNEFRSVFEQLERHDVEFIVVGRLAAEMHGAPPLAGDVDVVIRTSAQNYEKAADALRSMEARPCVDWIPEDAALGLFPPDSADASTLQMLELSRWRTRSGADVAMRQVLQVASNVRLGYDELASGAPKFDVGSVAVRLAPLDHVVAATRFAGRQQDRDMLVHLERLAAGVKPAGAVRLDALLELLDGTRFVIAGDAAVALHGHNVRVETLEVVVPPGDRTVMTRIEPTMAGRGTPVDALTRSERYRTDHGDVIVSGGLQIASNRTVGWSYLIDASTPRRNNTVAVVDPATLQMAARCSPTMNGDAKWTAINRLKRTRPGIQL